MDQIRAIEPDGNRKGEIEPKGELGQMLMAASSGAARRAERRSQKKQEDGIGDMACLPCSMRLSRTPARRLRRSV